MIEKAATVGIENLARRAGFQSRAVRVNIIEIVFYCLAGFEATGAKHTEMMHHVLGQVKDVSGGHPDSLEATNRTFATLHSLNPKDPLEGLLMAQMVGVHNLAMSFMGRAMCGSDSSMVEMNVNRATKLLRTFTAQVETSNRHRGKGQQKVTVEHVTVNQGGQAIVGAITTEGGPGVRGNE